MLTVVTQMIQGAPAWVWVLLGFIVNRGIRALSQRVIYLPSLFILPVVLVAFKLAYGLESEMLLYYGLGICIGAVIGYVKTQNQKGITVNKKTMEVTVPGSPQLLIILLLFFSVKYFFGYLEAVHTQVALDYMWLENILTGTVIGFLWGNTASYVRRYLQA